MERVVKKRKLREMRRSLRASAASAVAQIPFEIWWDIVCKINIEVMHLLAQTTKGFWMLVKEIRRRNIKFALEYRRIGQILLAKKCLEMCARHGIPEAMFHLGYAKQCGGFGFKGKWHKNNVWMDKASKAEHPFAMALVACRHTTDLQQKQQLVEKVFLSKDPFALGWCHMQIPEVAGRHKNLSLLFEIAANQGNEFAQYSLGFCYETGSGGKEKDTEMALLWYTKSANQGSVIAQKRLYQIYELLHDESLYQFWFDKARTQA